MSRIVLAALAAVLLLLPATADAQSGQRLRGIVTAEDAVRSFVTVSSARRDHVLRVQHAALQRIRVGMRVELRGKTLRRGSGSRVLSTNVLRVRSEPQSEDRIQADDDEIEVKGTLTSLAPPTVVAHGHSFSCTVPTGKSLAGFAVGDFVEMTCDLSGGVFVLRELEHEDDDEANRDDDEDDNSGPGNRGDDEEDDDNSGPGNGDDDDNSGPGSDDDDDDDDDEGGNRGPGNGDDDD